MSDGAAWLQLELAAVAQDPSRIRVTFPAVSRHVGRADGADDAARGQLLAALPLRGDDLVEEVTALYRFGDAHEKRGVLANLHRLDAVRRRDGIGSAALELVRDGLRSNDTRLVAAALSGYGATYLDDPSWRQAVLKCIFTSVPLDVVDRLQERADDQLAHMLVSFARERLAAGRDVPADVWHVLEWFPDVLANSELDTPTHSSSAPQEA
jgi:hypothetical protein